MFVNFFFFLITHSLDCGSWARQWPGFFRGSQLVQLKYTEQSGLSPWKHTVLSGWEVVLQMAQVDEQKNICGCKSKVIFLTLVRVELNGMRGGQC